MQSRTVDGGSDRCWWWQYYDPELRDRWLAVLDKLYHVKNIAATLLVGQLSKTNSDDIIDLSQNDNPVEKAGYCPLPLIPGSPHSLLGHQVLTHMHK